MRRGGKTDDLLLALTKLYMDPRAPRPARALAKVVCMSAVFERHPLSRGQRVRGLARMWAWQVWRRTAKRPVEIEMPGGARLVCPVWSELGGAVVSVGLTDVAELSFLMDALGAGDVFVDVGANIGLYSVVASRAGAQVIAFEPNGRARAALETNIEANGGSASFRCLDCALANQSGRLRFSRDGDVGNRLFDGSGDGAGSVEVEVRRLDDVLASMPDRPSPKVIKIDAEGWDLEVLRGAESTLRSARPVLLVEAFGEGLEIREWLAERAYVPCTYDWTHGVLAELPPDLRFYQMNLICVPASRREELDLSLRARGRRELGEPSVRWM